MSAKSDVEDVMIDLSIEVNSRFERDVPIETRVAETTPVSSACCQHDFEAKTPFRIFLHPKSRPLIPAANVKTRTNKLGIQPSVLPASAGDPWATSYSSSSSSLWPAISGAWELSILSHGEVPC